MDKEVMRGCGLICEGEPREETAKMLIEETGKILQEVMMILRMVEDAIYGPRVANTTQTPVDEPKTPPMLALLREQRDGAKEMLNIVTHIKGGLW